MRDEFSINAVLLVREADELFARREYERARHVYERAAHELAPVASRTGESVDDRAVGPVHASTLTEALAQVARTHLVQDRLDEALPWLERAGAVASPEQPPGWSRYLGVRGRAEWKTGDLDAAIRTFEAMFKYCETHNLDERAIDAIHMLALVASPERQVEWGRKGIALAERRGVAKWLGPLYNNLGWTLDGLGRHDEALDALRAAREWHVKSGNERAMLIADWSVGVACRKLGRCEEARQWLAPALDQSKRRFDANPDDADRVEWLGLCHRELAELALVERAPAAIAVEHFRAARTLLERAGMPAWDPNGFAELIERLSVAEGAATND